MKPIAVAIILSLAGASQVLAADLELPRPVGPPPASYYPVLAPVNWSGIYVGLNGGYDFGTSNWMNAGLSTGGFKTNGGLFGGTLGINYTPEAGGRFLFGFEGDMDLSNVNGTSSVAACAGIGVPGRACQTGSNWLGTMRVRAGYVFDRVLVFGTAGAALGDFRVALNPPSSFLAVGPQFGWTAGGGLEFAFSDRITAKVEYLYVNLGTVACPNSNACPAANAAGLTTGSVSLAENLVRAGVNYKFSW